MKINIVFSVLFLLTTLTSASEPAAAPSIFKLDRSTTAFEKRRWFKNTEDICKREVAERVLDEWIAELTSKCKSASGDNCVHTERSFGSPPQKTESLKDTCELYAKVWADYGDYGLNNSVNYKENEVPEFTKTQLDCLKGVEEQISKTSAVYADFINKLRSVHGGLSSKMVFSGCATTYWNEPPVRARLIELLPLGEFKSSREAFEDLTDSSDIISYPLYVHEMTHLLSSSIGDWRDLGFANEDESKKQYIYTVIRSHKIDRVSLDFIEGTPKMYELYNELSALKLELRHLDRYFSAKNNNDFFVLLDEWNAYLNQLQYTLLSTADCSSVKDSLMSVIEFVIYAHTYRNRLKNQNKNLYDLLSGNQSISLFWSDLVDRSIRLESETLKSKCSAEIPEKGIRAYLRKLLAKK